MATKVYQSFVDEIGMALQPIEDALILVIKNHHPQWRYDVYQVNEFVFYKEGDYLIVYKNNEKLMKVALGPDKTEVVIPEPTKTKPWTDEDIRDLLDE